MPEPRDLQLSSYDYPLPPERIAQVPFEPRHSARLLMVPPQGEPSIDAAHGQFNRLFALADRCEKGDSLGTDAQPISGIFHVAAIDHTAVFTAHSSPHVEVRVRAMGMAGGPASPHK